MKYARPARTHVSIASSLLVAAACLVLMYLVVPQLSGLSGGWHSLARADFSMLVLALLCVAGSYIAGALGYVVLAPRGLRFWRTVHIQLASGFTGRILPSGAGTAGLYVQYLRRSGYTGTQALGITAVNNLLTALQNGLLLLFIWLHGRSKLQLSLFDSATARRLLWIGLVVLLVIGIAALVLGWQKIRRFGQRTIRYMVAYRRYPWRLVVGLAAASLLTLSYSLALLLCARAFGMSISLADAIIVVSIGSAAVAATPTPGGIGGAEAGYALGFVALGFGQQDAVWAALGYRLLTYWLPLVPGFLMFLAVRRRYIFN